MSIEVKIPPVGESIESGVVSVWHKKSGEYVDAGEPLFTLETDKVSTEITAENAGLLETKVDEGQEVKIGEVVAIIDDKATAPAKAKEKAPAAREPAPPAKRPAEKRSPNAEVLSPAVKRITTEEKLDPAQISGTGKGGRLTKGDVLAHLQGEPPAPTDDQEKPRRTKERTPAEEAAESEGRFTRKKMSPLRRKIAAQMVMSQQTTATLTTFNECDMSEVMALRKKVQEKFQADHGVKLGFMSFFIKATVEALRTVPAINSRIEGDDFILNHYFDIGIAVGTERGLVVPVVRAADEKSFGDLERDIADFATRARDGKIKIEDLQGGTFTISNGGVYGSLMGTPILNPPQSGILGMHAIQQRPVAVNGEVVVRPMMYLALSYDHRAVDGKEAVTFLVKVKEAIENPTALLLEL
ncbi:MAG TPA: 2-oxoglutarate dehydrogenase complex dihydrolipoyllysine-residue succinyltransferase [Chthoniobacterales bacterium]|jgi:2-oxoglutarate dehydrogenase E2 component (dihydrolipoamide succinyltransferase)|nr:2-oxoglutarate dehydrogenase complex dihydrolipoyllysine-residue succinyltransferase [Chthoniobacterales bacterium]